MAPEHYDALKGMPWPERRLPAGNGLESNNGYAYINAAETAALLAKYFFRNPTECYSNRAPTADCPLCFRLSSASRAAACWASFLVLPEDSAITSPRMMT
jgi:hypothetical protein